MEDDAYTDKPPRCLRGRARSTAGAVSTTPHIRSHVTCAHTCTQLDQHARGREVILARGQDACIIQVGDPPFLCVCVCVCVSLSLSLSLSLSPCLCLSVCLVAHDKLLKSHSPSLTLISSPSYPPPTHSLTRALAFCRVFPCSCSVFASGCFRSHSTRSRASGVVAWLAPSGTAALTHMCA